MNPIEPIVAITEAAASSLEVGASVVESAVPATAGLIEASVVLPTAVEAGLTTTAEISSEFLTATGPKIGNAVESLKQLVPNKAFDALADTKVEATTIKDAFSPFREMSEEEFADRFPELVGDTSTENPQVESKGKVLPFNDEVAKRLDEKSYDSSVNESVAKENVIAGDLSEGEEIVLENKSIEERIKEMDLPDDMREKLPDIINMLREHPDLISALGDLNNFDEDKKKAVIDKIHKLIEEEKDPHRQSLLEILLVLLFGFLMTANQELKNAA